MSGNHHTNHLTRRPNGTLPRIKYTERCCPNSALKGPCHVFEGSTSTHGYGQVRLNGRIIKVHRYVWEQVHGPIPADKEIDHQCRVRACCNVDHLRLVTHRINMLENSNSVSAVNAAKTVCKHGHPFDGVCTDRSGRTRRYCKTCERLRVSKWRLANKAMLIREEGSP